MAALISEPKTDEVSETSEKSPVSISPIPNSMQDLAPPKKRRKKERPLLEPARNYTVPEAALAVGVAPITIWRALESSHLKCYRVVRRVICNGGQHLIPWLEAGGKTSRA
jgi:hypothetical protein